ncbi:flagellar hook-length control protein FliK [Noviherbaspirillum aerium]|uniref:flagellar hook-length control protein FliK n=1 Tax=Noviherbaspirillum aerium TaxID=2588497 RepID=UPI001CEF6293|nr:flagellar hook-length control protein FliK [Noviherbaspirillum aerium]
MQTPQVTNPAALFTTPAPAAKKADANSQSQTQSFGQMLSKEVAERQPANVPATKDTPAAPAKEAKSSTASAPSSPAQPATARPPAGEARPAVKQKSASEKAPAKDDPSEAKAASDQTPEDLLAMVANLLQMPAGTDAANPAIPAAPAEALPQQTQPMVDSAMLLAATGMLRPYQTTVQLDTSGIASGMQSGGTTLGPDIDGRHAGAKDILFQQTLKPQVEATGNGAPAGDLAMIAPKGQELMAGAENETAPTNFAAKLQDTLTQAPAAVQAMPQMAQVHAAARALESKAADRLAPAVGSSAWDQALGQKVVWMVTGEQQSASLTLNPPDLGPLQIVLNVNNSQASATFTAAQPEVRQALEAAMPKLRDMLGEAGIQLGQATVNSGSPNQQGQQGQSFGSRQGSQGDHHGGDGPVAGNTQVGRVAPSAGGLGMVDTFV